MERIIIRSILISLASVFISCLFTFSQILSKEEINALKELSLTPHLIDNLGWNPRPWIELLLAQPKEKMLPVYKDLLWGNAEKYQLPFERTYDHEENKDDYRYAAAYMLGKMELPEAHEILIKWLRSQSFYQPSRGFKRTELIVLTTAMSNAGDYMNPDDIKYFENFSLFSESNIRRETAMSLAKIGTPAACQVIQNMLQKEEDSSTKFSLIESLCACNDTSLLPVLQKIYDDPHDFPKDKDTIKFVMDSIKKRASDKVMASLEYVSNSHYNYHGRDYYPTIDKNVILQKDINFLLSLPTSKMIPIYKDLLYNNFAKYGLMNFKDPLTHKDFIYTQCSYRHGAANLLARINTPESISILRAWLKTQISPPPKDQWAWYGQFFDVETALAAIGNNYQDSDLSLLQKFLVHPDSSVRLTLANVLYQINTPQSIKLLNLMLKDPDVSVRTYIKKNLKQ